MELTEISSQQLLKTVEERKTDTKNKIRHRRAKLEKNYINVNLKKTASGLNLFKIMLEHNVGKILPGKDC